MNSEARFASENAALRKNVIGSIGCGARSSHATNAPTSASPTARAVEDLGARPAQLVAADQAPDDPEHAGADEADAGQVELARRPVALGQPGQRERHEQDADRDVEPEDVLPREALDDGTADDRAERDREPADRSPGAEREPALRRRHRSREDRQRQRHHDRAAEPLHGAGDVEHLDVRSERGGDRGEREDADADREHPPAPEAVTERGAGEEQDGEREGVGVDRPREALERGVEVEADHGDRGRDDEVVERDHEQRDRGDHERPDGLCACGHGLRPFAVRLLVISHLLRVEKREPSTPSSRSGSPR